MDEHDEVLRINRAAWDQQVEQRNRWTIPVSPEAIADARRGEWQILLTPCLPVPREWFPPLEGTDVLCLASGGGQQGPILAAAGARVTVLDNAPAQLERDRMVAEREGLPIRTVLGDMARLDALEDGAFDLIVHPVASCFVPDVAPVWAEAHRVLRPSGVLLAGLVNPLRYLFDEQLAESTGTLKVANPLPHSDLDDPARQERVDRGDPLEFGHTLEQLIGGQLAAGLVLTGLYEDRLPPGEADPLSRFAASFIATRAVRP